MTPRFIYKWINGYWVIFDTVEFKNMELALSRKHAIRLLKG